MLENLTLEDFAPHLNTTFRLPLQDAAPLELELVEITDGQSRGARNSDTFSLIFRGAETFFLPQRTYVIEHERIGAFLLFLVPVGREPDGFRYEAVFNRVRREG